MRRMDAVNCSSRVTTCRCLYRRPLACQEYYDNVLKMTPLATKPSRHARPFHTSHQYHKLVVCRVLPGTAREKRAKYPNVKTVGIGFEVPSLQFQVRSGGKCQVSSFKGEVLSQRLDARIHSMLPAVFTYEKAVITRRMWMEIWKKSGR